MASSWVQFHPSLTIYEMDIVFIPNRGCASMDGDERDEDPPGVGPGEQAQRPQDQQGQGSREGSYAASPQLTYFL